MTQPLGVWLAASVLGLVLGAGCHTARSPEAATPIRLDGQLLERAWRRAPVLRGFVFPWARRAPPTTAFFAFADATHFYFAFDVDDPEVIVAAQFTGEQTLDGEDRVEIFLARDASLARYYALEIDPLGRVHDYTASYYRQFDSTWNCPGLEVAGRLRPGGYVVEGRLPLAVLAELTGRTAAGGTTLRVGFFRAEFRAGARGEADDNWISWVTPRTAKPDFHVPSAFANWRVPRLGRSP